MHKKLKITFDKYICDKNIVKEKIDNLISKPKLCFYKLVIPTISVFCLILLIVGNYFLNTPYSYVSIDINPSIILTTNRLNRVIEIKSLNNDAKLLLKDLKIKNMEVNNANSLIIKKAIDLGFIAKNIDTNAILVTVYCHDTNKTKSLQQDINNHLHDCFNKNGVNSLIIDQTLTKEDINIANKYGVSQGKILFVKKAILNNPTLKFEDLIYLPIREIAKYIPGYENINNNLEHEHNNPEKCLND